MEKVTKKAYFFGYKDFFKRLQNYNQLLISVLKNNSPSINIFLKKNRACINPSYHDSPYLITYRTKYHTT
jgi:hypothetical protein